MRNISSFIVFLFELSQHIGCSTNNIAELQGQIRNENELAAKVLNDINKYFFQTHRKLDKKYISEFHQYWESNHEQILNPEINKDVCYKIADELEKIYRFNKIRVQLDTLDLTHKEIAQVRFFTAIQDFKIDINAKGNPFEFYKRFPECFSAEKIVENDTLVSKLLNQLGATDQGDKRQKWMIESAKLLLEKYSGDAFLIARKNDNDVLKIRNALLEDEVKYGFSTKKANMFIRDMIDLNVWKTLQHIEEIDIISDQNTIRIALRTGILSFRIPLLSSFLDVYCYQYSLVDSYNRLAWREVWNQWKNIKENHCPKTPASIDYFIYKMGKVACKRTSRTCPPGLPIKSTTAAYKKLSVQDRLIFNQNNFCIFSEICKTQNKPLNPPKSISQKGRTGWDQGKTNEGGGGGISS